MPLKNISFNQLCSSSFTRCIIVVVCLERITCLPLPQPQNKDNHLSHDCYNIPFSKETTFILHLIYYPVCQQEAELGNTSPQIIHHAPECLYLSILKYILKFLYINTLHCLISPVSELAMFNEAN